MNRQLLTTALALPLILNWRAAGQTAVPPSPPLPPAISSRMITISPPGSYLGIGIQEITAERAKALKLREDAGVEVTRVAPDSPAAKAGLKEGDVVLQYNGTKAAFPASAGDAGGAGSEVGDFSQWRSPDADGQSWRTPFAAGHVRRI